MPDIDTIVEMNGVSFAYSDSEMLFSNLDISLNADETVGIVGANGSGKTTLFSLIVGLAKRKAGCIKVFGRTLNSGEDYAFARRKIGLLFQNSEDQLFCPTVAEDVAFGPLNLGASRDEAMKIVGATLADLGLDGYEKRICYKLSGGEKKLVALAAVMSMRPEVLLLDEPASGLDPKSRRDLQSLLGRIGRTQVIASHDMEFVRSTCQRVIVMSHGTIMADGPTDSVLSDSGLLLTHGLEMPYSLDSVHKTSAPHDHHHGTGPSHGHGHGPSHDVTQHQQTD